MEKLVLSINTSCDQPGKEIPTLSMTLSAERMQMNCEMKVSAATIRVNVLLT
jgi:hypothetical protein